MEPETPAGVKIFFKGKTDELKGPYTEGEVQQWYRQKWFDSSFQFFFMKGDQPPTDQTEFRTLETLRSLNGIGCPFAPIKAESSNEKSEEKLVRLEKELADLSKKCDEVNKLEKRLEDVEMRLKELSTQQPTTSSSSATAPAATKPATASTAAKKPEKQPEENSEHTRLANAWAAFYLDVLEAYKTNRWSKVDGGKDKKMLISMFPALESEPLREKCREVLLKKLRELDYVYCSECDSIFYNCKQILLHVSAKQHHTETDALHELQKAVNMMMMKIFQPMIISLVQAEQSHIHEVIGKHLHISPNTPDLRPLLGLIDHFSHTYGNAVYDYGGNIDSNRAQIVARMIPRLKQNDTLGRKIMSELHEHIGDRQTRCYECHCTTGSREQYYQHLRTLAHITKSEAMDIITLIVNMYTKD